MEPLEVRAVLPGIIGTVVIALLGFTDIEDYVPWVFTGLNIGLFAIPWITLIVLRKSPPVYGYVPQRVLARYGWGMVAGGIWRGVSMTLNYMLIGGQISLGISIGSIVSGLVWVPLVEETFYRGYIGRALSFRYGMGIGIVIQALLFTLHPYHWSQGWPAWISILGFGLLAGYLVQKTGSIWIGWGAHGFANILPLILIVLSR